MEFRFQSAPIRRRKTDNGYLLFAAALDFARLAAQARSKAAFMAGVSFLLARFPGFAASALACGAAFCFGCLMIL